MPSVGFEPTTNGLCLPLRLSPRPARAGFRGLDFPFALRVCRQVSTPSPPRREGLGSGLPSRFRGLGFPEFGRFYARTRDEPPERRDSNVIRSQPYFGSRMEKVCVTCGASLTGRQMLFCSLRCKNSSTNNRHQNYVSQQLRGRQRRQRLIRRKGAGASGAVTAATKRRWPFTISTRRASPFLSTSGAARTLRGTRFRPKRTSVNSSV